jgi:hypothetical protein
MRIIRMQKKYKEKKETTNSNEIADIKLPEQDQNSCSGKAGYEIRVKDHLDTYWFEWFEGWTVTNLENGEVLLACARVDQSKLHGTLNKIRDLNLTLISVTCVRK